MTASTIGQYAPRGGVASPRGHPPPGAASAVGPPTRLLRVERQRHREPRAPAGRARGPRATAVSGDDRRDDRQPEPGARPSATAARVGAPEALEELRRV